MSCYISSNNNRFYAAVESAYGAVPLIAAANRFPGVKLTVKQEVEKPERKDKTGTRTFLGLPANLRRQTTFELRSYMTGWTNQTEEPGYGPLFRAALGGDALLFAGGTAGEGCDGRTVVFVEPHGLAAGQAVTFGGEIRFVTAIADEQTVLVNASFTIIPSAGSPFGPTVTYMPATRLNSASIFDYWSPEEAVQRIVCGAGIDRMQLNVNGDYHEFRFSGAAMDVLDSSSFLESQGQLIEFPPEPADEGYNYTIIPGHLGQAWLGTNPDRFFTITSAEVTLDNGLDLRAREFGSILPRCMAAGSRSVLVDVSLYGREDDATKSLYQAGRQRSPIEVMFQLGQDAGQLFGMYLKSVVPEVPEFDDKETRLQWHFRACRAQGTLDDEMVVAFG
ncbi:MAG: hypothetical protein ACE141_06475 [Bryobacteraceae bacterium]